MVLVDSSVWIDHLRAGNHVLAALLDGGHVYVHPFIIGEIALGKLRQRDLVLTLLQELPMVVPTTNDQVVDFISLNDLAGTGIGLVDAYLLASAAFTEHTRLWTRDKRLRLLSVWD